MPAMGQVVLSSNDDARWVGLTRHGEPQPSGNEQNEKHVFENTYV